MPGLPGRLPRSLSQVGAREPVTMSAGMINDRRPYILSIGDSLTAGYGLAARDAFPAQLEALLRETFPRVCVQNAGVSGDTSASALARLPRLLSSLKHVPNLAIIELGANDLLRGVAHERTSRNLDAIASELIRCCIPVLIAAMEAPPFLGGLARACDFIYVDLASRHGLPLQLFYPPGVLGNRDLSLPDRLHPNARGVSLIARHMLPSVLAALGTDRAFVRAA